MDSHKKLHLSVLDQSAIRRGSTPGEALNDTVHLARATEKYGYERYWVAEHHNSTSFTGNAPEILIGQIAANTSKIHVGSGGVMLQHYSALKIAEQFRMLDAFYPGRIDLGIGRAPGSDQLTANALAYPRQIMDIRQFPQMVSDLLSFLEGKFNSDHPFANIHTQPGPMPENPPQVWILGSGDFSAQLAALLGLPYSYADFFGTTGAHGPIIADIYRDNFKPSKYLREPKFNVAVQVLCANTTEEAEFIASSRNLNKVSDQLNLRNGLLPPEEASVYEIPPAAQKYIATLKSSYLDGDPSYVRERILDIGKKYDTQDISLITTCYSYDDRERSYKLLANSFGITDIDNKPDNSEVV